jgi:hypothetical protein
MKALLAILIVLGSFLIKDYSFVNTIANEHSPSKAIIQLAQDKGTYNFTESIEDGLIDQTLFNDNDDDDFTTFRKKIQLSRSLIHFCTTWTLNSEINSLRNNPSDYTHSCLPSSDRCILLQVFRI